MFEKENKNTVRKSARAPTPQKYTYTFGFSKRRKKTLMVIFVGAVSLTFLIGFGGVFFEGCDTDNGPKVDSAGTIAGEPVSRNQLAAAQRDVYVQFCLTSGVKPTTVPGFPKIRDRMAWQRLAALKYAEKLAIATSEKECNDTVVRQFIDRETGAFNQDGFNRFMTRTLLELEIRPKDYYHYIRDAITLAKLENIIGLAAWATPFDLSSEMAKLTDSFTIDTVSIVEGHTAKKQEISEDEAKSYYSKHAKAFKLPDRVRVKYVAFAVSDYLKNADKVAEAEAREYYRSGQELSGRIRSSSSTTNTFEDVKDGIMTQLGSEWATNYYDEHFDEYVTSDTNDVEIVRPFAEARDEILQIRRRQDATGMAAEEAMGFAEKLKPGSDGKVVPFETLARTASLTVSTSAYFGRNENLAHQGFPPSLNREAFNLTPDDPLGFFSYPIAGTSAVYVIAFDDRQASHVPEFAEVSNRVYELARNEKALSVMTDKARQSLDSLRAAVKAGKPFADAAKALNLPTESAGPFTMMNPPTNVAFSAALADSIVMRETGEFTDPVPSTNGMMIAYVRNRSPGPSDIGGRLAELIHGDQKKRLFYEWQKHIASGKSVPESTQDDEDQASDVEPQDDEDANADSPGDDM